MYARGSFASDGAAILAMGSALRSHIALSCSAGRNRLCIRMPSAILEPFSRLWHARYHTGMCRRCRMGCLTRCAIQPFQSVPSRCPNRGDPPCAERRALPPCRVSRATGGKARFVLAIWADAVEDHAWHPPSPWCCRCLHSSISASRGRPHILPIPHLLQEVSPRCSPWHPHA